MKIDNMFNSFNHSENYVLLTHFELVIKDTHYDRKEIKYTRIRLHQKIKDLKTKCSDEILSLDKSSGEYAAKALEIKAKYNAEIAEAKEKAKDICSVQKDKIKQIKFDNRHTPRRLVNEIQMIFQDPVDSLDPRMTVEDIIKKV